MKSRVVCVYLRYLIGMVCMMSDVVLLGGYMTSLALSLALRVLADAVCKQLHGRFVYECFDVVIY